VQLSDVFAGIQTGQLLYIDPKATLQELVKQIDSHGACPMQQLKPGAVISFDSTPLVFDAQLVG